MTIETITPIAKAIRERRSIKKDYLDIPVTEKFIMGILEEAVWAPTHGLREPWRFIIVPTENKNQFVEDMITFFPEERRENRRKYFEQPAAFLIVIMPKSEEQKKQDEDFGAVSCLIHNFQLLAWEKDLGVVWKTNPHIYDPGVEKLLDLETNEKIAGFLHLGFFEKNNSVKAQPRTSPLKKSTIYGQK
ncbi:nitroreductase family protein [Alkalicoccus daliensis]|uniref:Nitroreductase n=1 Tax=Alkalicoccus daliensis TaxID=745820 RepID=A0A1H0GYQ8_9BACI|nr:nitroreductase [Alkalicoccus daliensis]SDO11952.1 Nitroreductase [Alkalicoccus daliensis]